MPLWLACILCLFLLITSGIAYRVAASSQILAGRKAIELPLPLSTFPLEIGDWVGRDVPIPENIQRAAKNDDFLNRLYENKRTRQWANVYVAFSARPRTMLGHRPQVCYPAGGWVHDGTEPSQLISSSGRAIPCLTHRFHWPSAERQDRVVLNFYVLNGRLTSDESGFSGVSWRTPNIGGKIARYVAQVQVSSVIENPVRKAAREMTDAILEFLPDEDGNVKAAERIKLAADPAE